MLVSCGYCCGAKRAGAESAARIEKRSGTGHHSGQLPAFAAEEKSVHRAAASCAIFECPSRRCAPGQRAGAKFPAGERFLSQRNFSQRYFP
jgi:hypothetical protein